MDGTNRKEPIRVLLLTTTRSYRNTAFLSAAERIGIQIVQAIDLPEKLSQIWDAGFSVDFRAIEDSVARITAFHQDQPLKAVLPVDDSGSLLAAAAGEVLGLPHNSSRAARATRDKLTFRQYLAGHGLNSPRFREYWTGETLTPLIAEVGFPCVVKPRTLNGSRGVIRADNLKELEAAIKRTAKLVRSIQGRPPETAVSILIEEYIPGEEVAVEGIIDNGRLEVLALFDKPDPLEGPFFEETIYVTPSRLSIEKQHKIIDTITEAAQVIGLKTGPIHAELRLNDQGPWIVEIAGRSIGGLCSQVLKFGASSSLEEIILKQACGLDYGDLVPSKEARGVMMIPIPGAGLLRDIEGMDQAKKTPHIEGIEITLPLHNTVTPLPEGDGYLGFIFSRGDSPESVEKALRQAHRALTFRIDPLLPVLKGINSPL
jgi:biotin carboxylase